jgi:hypothetical protein
LWDWLFLPVSPIATKGRVCRGDSQKKLPGMDDLEREERL